MKTNYTIEEWTSNDGLFDDVPAHRVGAVVDALNYTLVWVERILSTGVDDVLDYSILPIIVMTIVTIIDVSESELDKILNDAYLQYGDFMIARRKFHRSELEVESEFTQLFCEKVIKKHANRLQLN